MVWIAGLCWGLSEKALAPHSSTLAWNIPWMEEPGRLQSMGLLRVGHDWATFLSLFTFMHWRRQWQPTPVFLPGESQGAWWAAVYGVTQIRTRLKWLSSGRSLLILLKSFLPGILSFYLPQGPFGKHIHFLEATPDFSLSNPPDSIHHSFLSAHILS